MCKLLVQFQATIDAIDRAIADEKNIASTHAPPTPSAPTPPTAGGFIDPQEQRRTREVDRVAASPLPRPNWSRSRQRRWSSPRSLGWSHSPTCAERGSESRRRGRTPSAQPDKTDETKQLELFCKDACGRLNFTRTESDCRKEFLSWVEHWQALWLWRRTDSDSSAGHANLRCHVAAFAFPPLSRHH
jgi:hypothetical protein